MLNRIDTIYKPEIVYVFENNLWNHIQRGKNYKRAYIEKPARVIDLKEKEAD